MDETKAEPRGVVVPSDDCVVPVDGEPTYPHKGECIRVIRGRWTIEEVRVAGRLGAKQADIDALEESDPGYATAVDLIFGGMVDDLQRIVARRVIEWDWTDAYGARMALPSEDPHVFNNVTIEELVYVFAACRGSNPAAEGKG